VTSVQDWFVPVASRPGAPQSSSQWATMKESWLKALRSHVLDECPELPAPCELAAEFRPDGVTLRKYRLFADGVYPLDLYVAAADVTAPPASARLEILDQAGYEKFAAMIGAAAPELARGVSVNDDGRAAWRDLVASLRAPGESGSAVRAWFVPRGIGPTEWTRDPRERTHVLRRFSLLGLTADELQTYDVVQAVRAMRGLPGSSADVGAAPLTLAGSGAAAGWALYAAILHPDVQQLDLVGLAATHDVGPIYLNVRRYFDIPEALAMAAQIAPLRLELTPANVEAAEFADQAAQTLQWGDQRVEVFSGAD
jgi:hypothetical protein